MRQVRVPAILRPRTAPQIVEVVDQSVIAMRATEQAVSATTGMPPEPVVTPASETISTPSDAVAALPARAFTLAVRFQSCDPEQNRARFYDLQWQPALWGGGALIRVWGRLGSQGQRRVDFFRTRADAQAQIDRLLRQRLARGYQLVAWQ